jgi:P27 family predicted phage terminase small subunit
MPSAPKRFAGHALEFWNEHAALLKERGQLTRDSRASLEALCECYAEWRELQEDLATNGRFQKVKTGSDDTMERARPALAAYQDADRRLKGWLIEFGLTDASRGKVSAEPPQDDSDDPLAAYGLN